MHTVGERLYLFLCLEHGELRGLHETSCNEVQTEVLFLVGFLSLDHPAYETLDLWDEPDQDEGVGHIKTGMEGCQYERQFGGVAQECLCGGVFLGHRDIISHHATNHIHERTEDKENPEHAEEVEEQVGQCRPSCLCVGRHGSKVRGDGGADILTHYQCDTLIDRQHTARAEDHRDSHHGCRRLHAEGEHTTQQEEYQCGGEGVGIEGCEEVEHSLLLA